ncbi:hypothetical protein LZ30DRAFT_707813 [Colletotrichum cereale]|nr:hypothetical protein LZ30DRAFT_707813 [Colletotrichum cereale]
MPPSHSSSSLTPRSTPLSQPSAQFSSLPSGYPQCAVYYRHYGWLAPPTTLSHLAYNDMLLSWPAGQFAASRSASLHMPLFQHCHPHTNQEPCFLALLPRFPAPQIFVQSAAPFIPSRSVACAPFFLPLLSPPQHPTPAVSKPASLFCFPLLAGPVVCTTLGATDGHNDAIWCRPCGRMANRLSGGPSACSTLHPASH